MAENKKSVVSPIFRVSYPHLFTPQKSDDGKDVYGVTMIFEPNEDFSAMRELLAVAKLKMFGANPEGKFKPTFHKGNSEEYDLKKNPEYSEKIIATARSYNKPVGVVKLDKSKPKTDPTRFVPITDPNEFYSGCYAMAALTAFGYEVKGNKGVSLGLQNVIFVRHGEPLVVRSNPEADFGEVDLDLFEDTDNSGLFEDDLPF